MKKLPTFVWDMIGLVGLFLVTMGLGWAWGPLYLLTPGAACLGLAYMGAKRAIDQSR